jgi:uncharacterized protein (DUF486 family)
MNKIVKLLIFGVFIFMASLAYSFANFSEAKNKTNVNILSLEFLPLVAIALGYAFFEYSFKIPGYYLVRDILSPLELQMIWLLITSISVILFQKFYLNKEIQFHSYVTFALIIIILIIDMQFKK